jgi:succinate dehydrogenase / fumarate reductase flavoprotein subunit
MGRFAGERAVEMLEDDAPTLPGGAGERTMARFARYLEGKGKGNPGLVRATMQSLMTEKVGVFRTEQGIQEAISLLEGLKAQADEAPLNSKSLLMSQELVQRWELDDLLGSAMVISQGALHRRDSRGGHFREDFPERREELNDHTLVYMTEFGKVRLEKRPVDMSIHAAKGEHYEKFGMIERKY